MGNGGNADDFGLPFELCSITSNTHDLAKVDIIVVVIGDKNTIGSSSITVTGQVLEIETSECWRRSFVITDDHTLGSNRSGDGCCRAIALDAINVCVWRQTHIACAEAGYEIHRHGMRWTVAVLIGDLAGEDGQGAGVAIDEIRVRLKSKDSGATSESRTVNATQR